MEAMEKTEMHGISASRTIPRVEIRISKEH